MSHIAVDARELRTSSGRYVERLLYYLQQLNSDHQFTVLLSPKDIDDWQPSNPRFTKLACPHKEFTFGEQLGFLNLLTDLTPDLVHFAMVQQPIGYRGRVVTTMHDLTTVRFINPAKNPVVYRAKQQVYIGVNKYVARKSLALLTPTAYVRDDVSRFTGVPAAKITVTYEAADQIPDAAEPLPALASRRFIMYVGRPLPHKNLDRLIDAYALLKASYPDLQLVLAGKTDVLYERYYEAVQQRSLEGVVFTGYVNEGQLRWLYERCAAYVFPSLSEGFGLPGLEAMLHGAPVASSNATCLPEVYGPAAHYFDPFSTQDMANKLSDLLSNQSLRARLVTVGHKQAASYSWRRMAEQTLAVYDQVLRD